MFGHLFRVDQVGGNLAIAVGDHRITSDIFSGHNLRIFRYIYDRVRAKQRARVAMRRGGGADGSDASDGGGSEDGSEHEVMGLPTHRLRAEPTSATG